jgi:hypothetical protein
MPVTHIGNYPLNPVEQMYFELTGKSPVETITLYEGLEEDAPTYEYIEWLETRVIETWKYIKR